MRSSKNQKLKMLESPSQTQMDLAVANELNRDSIMVSELSNDGDNDKLLVEID
jgi:hypothetical protein